MLLTSSELVLSGDLAPTISTLLQQQRHRQPSDPLLCAGVAGGAFSLAVTLIASDWPFSISPGPGASANTINAPQKKLA